MSDNLRYLIKQQEELHFGEAEFLFQLTFIIYIIRDVLHIYF